ncbi:MAG: response regulator transcription factor [Anaerolineae bacterium]|nr:response regulator transcription factor [Anaerolineae bacterium]
MSQPIKIIIADSNFDHARKLKEFLDQQPGMSVVGIVQDGQGVVDSCKEVCPDLILLDLHLPVLDSIKTIQRITAYNEGIRILTTSSIPDDRYALEAVKAGAWGYIEKNDDNETTINTIRQVADGDVSLNPALAASILAEFHRLTG